MKKKLIQQTIKKNSDNMAIIKISAMRDMDTSNINKKMAEIKLELVKEKAKIAVGGIPDNPGKIREMKKTLAKILTLKNERQRKSNARNM